MLFLSSIELRKRRKDKKNSILFLSDYPNKVYDNRIKIIFTLILKNDKL